MKRINYYIIQWTWGLLTNILGLICSIGCLCMGGKFSMYRNAIDIELPYNCGGMSLGMFIFRGKNTNSILPHEYGHSIQNLEWGSLFVFVIGLPSLIRFCYRNYYYKNIYPNTRKSLPPYDSIWFEGQATQLGNDAVNGKWNWL